LEKMLLVSPSLANTLGLEGALLVQVLQEMELMQSSKTVSFSEHQRQTLFPFWSLTQFGSVLSRLQALGIVQYQGQQPWQIRCELPDLNTSTETISAPQTKQSAPAENKPNNQTVQMPKPQSEPVPVYSMNEARQRNQYDDDLAYLKQPTAAKQKTRGGRKTTMHTSWEPSEDFPQLLSFHDIPLQFALSELAKFRQYYAATDRTEISWDVRFLNWVQRSWHDSLNGKGRNDKQQATNGEPADSARTKRTQVRDALRNIQDTDW
jgi:hypothetical protein